MLLDSALALFDHPKYENTPSCLSFSPEKLVKQQVTSYKYRVYSNALATYESAFQSANKVIENVRDLNCLMSDQHQLKETQTSRKLLFIMKEKDKLIKRKQLITEVIKQVCLRQDFNELLYVSEVDDRTLEIIDELNRLKSNTSAILNDTSKYKKFNSSFSFIYDAHDRLIEHSDSAFEKLFLFVKNAITKVQQRDILKEPFICKAFRTLKQTPVYFEKCADTFTHLRADWISAKFQNVRQHSKTLKFCVRLLAQLNEQVAQEVDLQRQLLLEDSYVENVFIPCIGGLKGIFKNVNEPFNTALLLFSYENIFNPATQLHNFCDAAGTDCLNRAQVMWGVQHPQLTTWDTTIYGIIDNPETNHSSLLENSIFSSNELHKLLNRMTLLSYNEKQDIMQLQGMIEAIHNAEMTTHKRVYASKMLQTFISHTTVSILSKLEATQDITFIERLNVLDILRMNRAIDTEELMKRLLNNIVEEETIKFLEKSEILDYIKEIQSCGFPEKTLSEILSSNLVYVHPNKISPNIFATFYKEVFSYNILVELENINNSYYRQKAIMMTNANLTNAYKLLHARCDSVPPHSVAQIADLLLSHNTTPT